jgi:hypothetical protein
MPMKNQSNEIPCLTEEQKEKLIEAAEQTALRFCAPVYLVGSALTKTDPNDIDIYVAVDEQTYLRLFTNYGKKAESESDHVFNMKAMQVQQAKIYKKQKEYYYSKVKSWDFDIKFQVREPFLKVDAPRIRLDAIYEGVW